MNPALADLPLWAAIPAALLLLLGAGLTLIGAWGLVSIRGFYDRLHVTTLGTSWGTGAVVLAVILLASAAQGHLAMRALAIGVFVIITTPVTMVVLARAALQRDRAEGADVPPPASLPEPETDSAADPAAGPAPAALPRD